MEKTSGYLGRCVNEERNGVYVDIPRVMSVVPPARNTPTWNAVALDASTRLSEREQAEADRLL